MLKFALFALIGTFLMPHATVAQSAGDATTGAQSFQQCKNCHGIVAPDGTVIERLSPTGPNLWGVVERVAGSYPDYARFSGSIRAAGEAGTTWTQANFGAYVADPTAFLRDVTGDPRARSNMNHRLSGSADDIFAYLSQFR